jgi:hypothetical protein
MPYLPASYTDETPDQQMFNNPAFGSKVVKYIASTHDTEVFYLPYNTYAKFASKSSKFASIDEKAFKTQVEREFGLTEVSLKNRASFHSQFKLVEYNAGIVLQ